MNTQVREYEMGGFMVDHPDTAISHHAENLSTAISIAECVDEGIDYQTIQDTRRNAEAVQDREILNFPWMFLDDVLNWSPTQIAVLTQLIMTEFDYHNPAESVKEENARYEQLEAAILDADPSYKERQRWEQIEDEIEWCLGTAVSPPLLT